MANNEVTITKRPFVLIGSERRGTVTATVAATAALVNLPTLVTLYHHWANPKLWDLIKMYPAQFFFPLLLPIVAYFVARCGQVVTRTWTLMKPQEQELAGIFR